MSNITGVRVKISSTDSYLEALNTSYESVQQNHNYANRVTFAMLSQAYVEYACNSLLADILERNFEENRVKDYHEYFSKLSIRGKIELVVPLASNYEFVVNKEHETIKNLFDMISIRNKVIHKTDKYSDIEAGLAEDSNHPIFTFSTSDPILERLTIEKIQSIYQAAVNFVALTQGKYIQNNLNEGDFILRNPKRRA